MKNNVLLRTALVLAVSQPLSVFAAGITGEIEEVFITESAIKDTLAGEAEAASIGTVLGYQLEHRPILRPAEVLETIPGMVITQHSGGGKANQYFLRGFNLDHSTDFATYFEGAPVNVVSHGHGQGYTDLNFLIPEMMDRMVYKKGPYYASEGDFSSAGSARIYYAREKETNQFKLKVGEGNYRRALFHGGYSSGDSNWVYALERTENDGHWESPDDLTRDNAFLKYTKGNNEGGFSVSAMLFKSDWNGTDQIPQEYVRNGTLSRYDTLDPTTGGETHRYQLSYEQWAEVSDNSRIKANAYLVDYDLTLSGNFTYFLNYPRLGDQITQFDERTIFGGKVEWELDVDEEHQIDVGLDLRYDDIGKVGVGESQARVIHTLLKNATVDELSAGLYTSLHSQWGDKFASIVGLRYDYFDVDVNDKKDAIDSGSASDTQVSPKVSLRFGPFNETEFFVNYGKGFHSNDARGVVSDEGGVPLISPSTGYEIGVSSNVSDTLHLNFVLFALELDSELVFVGDNGDIEPKAGTRRKGFELSAYYKPVDWFVLDADFTKAEARFKHTQYELIEDGERAGELDLLGDYVPDSIADVFSMGASFEMENGFYGGLRVRYFGPRNLNESGDIKSRSTSVVNANAGYQFQMGLFLGLEVLNLTGREGDDITYLYESRPVGELDTSDGDLDNPANLGPTVDGFHSHPMGPREIRVTFGYEF